MAGSRLKQFVKKLVPPSTFLLVKRAALRILNPSPMGIGRIGINSYIRRPYRIFGASHFRIGDRTFIGEYSYLYAVEEHAGDSFSPRLVIGNDVNIGRYSCLTCMNELIIEDGCLLSEHVYIADAAHGLDPEGGPLAQQKLVSKGPIRLGYRTFVGYRACIMPGVTLGKHCIVGANSVVTRSFPDYSMIAGAPAQLIKVYSAEARDWVPIAAK